MSVSGAAGWIRGVVVPVGVIACAELASLTTGQRSETLAPPHEIVLAFLSDLMNGTLVLATLQTLCGALAGLAIGFSAGVFAGTVLGISKLADRLMFVSVEIIRPIPSIALIPIAMLVFGFGYKMEIWIVAFATLWSSLLLTRAAASAIEPRLLEVARVLGYGIPATIWKIVLPAALPRIFVALRLTAGVALIVAVTVEVTANPLGLGHALMNAQQSLRPAHMLAVICWLGAVGWGLNHALLLLQRRLFDRAAATGRAQ